MSVCVQQKHCIAVRNKHSKCFKFNKFCKDLGFSKQFKTIVTKSQMPYLSFEL